MTDTLFGKPEVMTARRVLAIQPHYDDNDIAAGGSLAALARAGAEIHYLTVTDDLVGVIDESLSPETAAAQLRAEQAQAGALIGVSSQAWLDYPDAGQYDYFDLRRDLIRHMRLIRPDFIFTCDPWMPYEAHNDHILTGKAAAEAAILFNLTRLQTDPEVDDGFVPVELQGIAFYASAWPNTVVDISQVVEAKHAAVRQYRAQFEAPELEQLVALLDYKERETAADLPFSHGEPLKVLRSRHLHVYPDAWMM